MPAASATWCLLATAFTFAESVDNGWGQNDPPLKPGLIEQECEQGIEIRAVELEQGEHGSWEPRSWTQDPDGQSHTMNVVVGMAGSML